VCTLILLDRVVPAHPLLVASNRDEYYARAAAPPALVGGDPAFVAPQDLEGGGTWMGVNKHGLFVGLTNRPTEARDPSRRSRGLLVIDALRESDAEGVARQMSRDVEGQHNPFNLLCADGRRTFVTCQREGGLETEELGPGVQVLCNRDINDPAVPKIAGILERLDRIDLGGSFSGVFEGLAAVLREHAEEAPLSGVCVHTAGYGTRSSAILSIGGDRWRYWFADGPPCEAKYQNLTTLLDDLRAG
jgi:uncharacterized protein with NRDE domain